MELQQLRYFLEVAQSQHVTRSAQKLHIAQPALSQAIRRLEKELEAPLFASRGRGVALTEAGNYLKERLTPLMRELDSLPERVRAVAERSRGTVHMNVLAASTLITAAIIEYRRSHPDAAFQLTQNEEQALCDISVTTLPSDRNAPAENDACRVYAERIFLAVPNRPPYSGMSRIPLSDVQDEGFISLLGSRQMRWICDRLCHQAGFQPRVLFESDSPAAVKNMIAANMGVGFWPQFSWGPLESDEVLLMEVNQPICQRNLVITLRQGAAASPGSEEFFRFLSDYCARKSQLQTR